MTSLAHPTCNSLWLALLFGVVLESILPIAHAETFHHFPDGERVSDEVLKRSVVQYIEIANREQKYGRDSHEVALAVRDFHEILANAGVRQNLVALGDILITGSISNWHSSSARLNNEERDILRGLQLLKSAALSGCHYESAYREGRCKGKRLSIPSILRDYYHDGVVDYKTNLMAMQVCMKKDSPSEPIEQLRRCREKSSERIFLWNPDLVQAKYWAEKAQACEAELAKINSERECN